MKDRVCDDCGLIHQDGISWHGRCYKCGGDLVSFKMADVELVAITPIGLKIYNQITKAL
jgi:hypothetical protein